MRIYTKLTLKSISVRSAEPAVPGWTQDRNAFRLQVQKVAQVEDHKHRSQYTRIHTAAGVSVVVR